MKSITLNLKKSIAAGIVIGIGSTVFLLCDSKIIGALLFSVGLFAICSLKLNLFTGRIGYVIENKNYFDCLLTWVGNLIGCALTVIPMRTAKPELIEFSNKVVDTKLNQNIISVLFLGMLCGVIMYMAIENYKNNSDCGRQVGVFLFVTVFIICGFEHSIANMCYFLFSIDSLEDVTNALLFIVYVSIANGIGSILFRYLSKSNK